MKLVGMSLRNLAENPDFVRWIEDCGASDSQTLAGMWMMCRFVGSGQCGVEWVSRCSQSKSVVRIVLPSCYSLLSRDNEMILVSVEKLK